VNVYEFEPADPPRSWDYVECEGRELFLLRIKNFCARQSLRAHLIIQKHGLSGGRTSYGIVFSVPRGLGRYDDPGAAVAGLVAEVAGRAAERGRGK
jgi:hypothetical protein